MVIVDHVRMYEWIVAIKIFKVELYKGIDHFERGKGSAPVALVLLLKMAYALIGSVVNFFDMTKVFC